MLLVIIIMFCIDLWGFYTDTPYFDYNSVGQENLVLCILTFRDLPELNLTCDFWALIFYHENLIGHKKSRGATRPKRAQVARVPG
jgi:hypothetical protein